MSNKHEAASPRAKLRSWLIEPLSTEVSQSVERLRRAEDVRHVALMPDVHLAHDVCVGVAMATERLIYPAAVGSDIGCGMAAVMLEADASLLDDEQVAATIIARLHRSVPSMKHSRATVLADLPPCVRDMALSDPALDKLKTRDGRFQLGTLGRGNHFVELQADEQDRLWLMVHSGSRGMGQAITDHHVLKARERGNRDKLLSLDANNPPGQSYLNDIAWAIAYAEQNRLAIIAAIERMFVESFGVAMDRETLIHANHNHVRRETHHGNPYWVHRKGAMWAAAGEPGVIPGSMGSASYHVSGRGEAESLSSSSHGAGRELSRGEASKTIQVRRLEREMRGVWFDRRRAAMLCDEAPSAYKDIQAVMRAQRELTKIERRLRPLLSYK